MGKKYFCDYCLRSFNDDKTARSKHQNSVQHLKLKKEHYDLFRDPRIIIQEESKKKPCWRFHYDGNCPFGSNCTYSHYSSEDIESLKVQANELEGKNDSMQQLKNISFHDWLDKRNIALTKRKSSKSEFPSYCQSSDRIPEEFGVVQELPISIKPFTIKDFVDADIAVWGE